MTRDVLAAPHTARDGDHDDHIPIDAHDAHVAHVAHVAQVVIDAHDAHVPLDAIATGLVPNGDSTIGSGGLVPNEGDAIDGHVRNDAIVTKVAHGRSRRHRHGISAQ